MVWGEEIELSDDEGEEEYVAVDHSYTFRQSGRHEVGGNPDTDVESIRVEVEFPTPFPDDVVPIVFCQAEGEADQTWGDVFGATVIGDSVSNTGFQVNIGRIGESNSWGQNLLLNWVAIHSNNPMIQAYTVDGGNCAEGRTIEVECAHPSPLPPGMRPMCFAVCVGDDWPDTFCVSIKKMNRHRAIFTISRGIDAGWGQQVRLNVLAVADGILPTIKVDLGSGAEQMNTYPDIPFGASLPAKPVALTICQHQSQSDVAWSDCFGCCVANVQQTDFQVNLARVDLFDAGWGQNVRANIILFP